MSIAPAGINVDDAASNARRCELWSVTNGAEPYEVGVRICVARTYPHGGVCQASRRITRYAPIEIDVGGPIPVNRAAPPAFPIVQRATRARAKANGTLPDGDCGVACWAVFRVTLAGRVYEFQNEQIAPDPTNTWLPDARIVFGYRSEEKGKTKYYGANLPGGVSIVLRDPYVAVRNGAIASAGYDELTIADGMWTDAIGLPIQRTRCFIDPDAPGGAGGGAAAAPRNGQR